MAYNKDKGVRLSAGFNNVYLYHNHIDWNKVVLGSSVSRSRAVPVFYIFCLICNKYTCVPLSYGKLHMTVFVTINGNMYVEIGVIVEFDWFIPDDVFWKSELPA